MERYEAYKDSGVEWIGEIPEGWGVARLGEVSYIRARLGWRALKADEYVEEGYPMYSAFNIVDGRFIPDNANRITEQRYLESPEIMMAVGDIMLVKDGAGVGKCAVVRETIEPSTVNGSIALITPSVSQDSRYLYYFFGSNAFQHFSRMLMGGMGVPHLFQRDIKLMKVAQPNFAEQQAIADYLDAKTAEIDGLVADCEREVGLLQEYRKAVISEAVTKGLDPDAPMKDSGVEWIGEIPEGWSMPKLRSLTLKIGSGKTPRGGVDAYVDHGTMLLRSQNIYDTGLELENVVFIDSNTDEEMRSTRVRFSDVLLNITGGSIGRCCIYDRHEPANVNQHVCIIRPSRLVNSRFVQMYWNSRLGETTINMNQSGANREGINFDQIAQAKIPLPPLDEQREIVAHLDAKTAEVDGLIEAKRQMAEKLREYRKSLVSEAVTGKFKVPGVA